MSNNEFTKLSSVQEENVIPSAKLRIAALQNPIEINRPSTEATLTEAYKARNFAQGRNEEKTQKVFSAIKDNLIKQQQNTQ